jgi:hypothetical protein
MNLPAITIDFQIQSPNQEEVYERNVIFVVIALLVLPLAFILAQDPVKVDAKHYKVEFEMTMFVY